MRRTASRGRPQGIAPTMDERNQAAPTWHCRGNPLWSPNKRQVREVETEPLVAVFVGARVGLCGEGTLVVARAAPGFPRAAPRSSPARATTRVPSPHPPPSRPYGPPHPSSFFASFFLNLTPIGRSLVVALFGPMPLRCTCCLTRQQSLQKGEHYGNEI